MTTPKSLSAGLIDSLLADYKKPEDLIGGMILSQTISHRCLPLQLEESKIAFVTVILLMMQLSAFEQLIGYKCNQQESDNVRNCFQ